MHSGLRHAELVSRNDLYAAAQQARRLPPAGPALLPRPPHRLPLRLAGQAGAAAGDDGRGGVVVEEAGAGGGVGAVGGAEAGAAGACGDDSVLLLFYILVHYFMYNAL